MQEYLIEVVARVPSASAIVFNTFDELERDAMNGLSSMLPFLYTIGPLPLLLNQSPQNNFASFEPVQSTSVYPSTFKFP